MRIRRASFRAIPVLLSIAGLTGLGITSSADARIPEDDLVPPKIVVTAPAAAIRASLGPDVAQPPTKEQQADSLSVSLKISRGDALLLLDADSTISLYHQSMQDDPLFSGVWVEYGTGHPVIKVAGNGNLPRPAIKGLEIQPVLRFASLKRLNDGASNVRRSTGYWRSDAIAAVNTIQLFGATDCDGSILSALRLGSNAAISGDSGGPVLTSDWASVLGWISANVQVWYNGGWEPRLNFISVYEAINAGYNPY